MVASVGNSSSSSNVSLLTDDIRKEDPAASLEFKAIKIFLYFFILICTTVGNSMAIFVICTSRKMKTPSHALILNLSLCDLVTPLVSIPFDFAIEENAYIWKYGSFMCKFLWPCSTFSSTSASLTLAAISLDRYRLIMHPFKAKLSSKHVKIIIFAVHLVSVVFVIPYVNALKVKNGYCSEFWPNDFPYRKGYTVALFLIQYSLPLIFMVVMYTLAVRNLHFTTRRMRKNSIRYYSEQHKDSDSEISCTKTKFRGFSRYKMSSDFWKTPNAKAIKMFIVVVFVFAIFMFPNQVLWLWLDLGQNASHPYLNLIKVVCWLFTYANSVCNPFIYCLFCQDFRRGFKRLFVSILCCKRAIPPWKINESTGLTSCSVNESIRQSFATQRRLFAGNISDARDNFKQTENAPVYSKGYKPRVSFDLAGNRFAKSSIKSGTYSDLSNNQEIKRLFCEATEGNNSEESGSLSSLFKSKDNIESEWRQSLIRSAKPNGLPSGTNSLLGDSARNERETDL